ncbi:MAG: hypothetical protein SWY16_13250 [Cyanobacteriota bacterium]|nr:hypothetical protein [Cyanobacteriota bacterium]
MSRKSDRPEKVRSLSSSKTIPIVKLHRLLDRTSSETARTDTAAFVIDRRSRIRWIRANLSKAVRQPISRADA